VLWLASLAANGTWDVRLVVSGTEYYVRVLRSTLIAFASTGLVGFIGSVDAARPFVLFAFPTGTVVIIANRWLIRSWARRKAPVQRVVIVGSNHLDTHNALVADSAMRIQVVGSRDSVNPGEIGGWCRTTSAEVVVIGANHGLSQYELRELMWTLDEEGVEVWFDAATQFIRTGKGIMIPSKQTTLMVFDPVHLSDGQRLVKRTFDVVFAVIALVVLVPILVVSSLAILVTMGRPVVFVQKRIGRDGKLFSIWKLRTMKNGESGAVPFGMSKNPNDPRVTAVGRVLRRWSIDEIPQFLNVLRGNMSVVGPRPRLPEELVSSSVTSRRLRAKPGITGPWQTSGRSLMTLTEADALDVNYVDSWSLLGDVVIVLRTVRVVFSGRGAF
jgi:lipopolysaccharide/colanic/teichoic acid biosynthesis glycosyltransferase